MYAQFNTNNNLEGFSTIENFAVSDSYSQQERDAYTFFGIDITEGRVTDPNKFDTSVSSPNFLTNYNIIMQTEGSSSNSDVVSQLKALKELRDQNKANTISVLEAKYNNLTAALKQYETDEKQVWQNLNTAKDADFMKKRESYLIQQKLDRLKNERNMVFNDLTNEYNNLTKYKSNLLKLRDRDQYVKKFQNNLNKTNTQKIDSINQDLITRRRQSQINMDNYYRQDNTIFYLRILFVFTLLAIIPIILGISGVFNKTIASMISAVIFVIAALIMIMRYVDNRNRSKLLWQEREFNADFKATESENEESSCNNNNDDNPIASLTENFTNESDVDSEKNVKAFW